MKQRVENKRMKKDVPSKHLKNKRVAILIMDRLQSKKIYQRPRGMLHNNKMINLPRKKHGDP